MRIFSAQVNEFVCMTTTLFANQARNQVLLKGMLELKLKFFSATKLLSIGEVMSQRITKPWRELLSDFCEVSKNKTAIYRHLADILHDSKSFRKNKLPRFEIHQKELNRSAVSSSLRPGQVQNTLQSLHIRLVFSK